MRLSTWTALRILLVGKERESVGLYPECVSCCSKPWTNNKCEWPSWNIGANTETTIWGHVLRANIFSYLLLTKSTWHMQTDIACMKAKFVFTIEYWRVSFNLLIESPGIILCTWLFEVNYSQQSVLTLLCPFLLSSVLWKLCVLLMLAFLTC